MAVLLDLLPFVMLAGLVGLDVVSFPQAMVSRPIVAATLAGALAGAPVAGLVCGAALECIALEALPVGASRYPEWGSASVVAGALAAVDVSGADLPTAGAFATSVALGIALAALGGWTMVLHRRFIAAMARPRLEQLATGRRQTVVGLQVFGMTVDLARGAALATVALPPGRWLVAAVDARWQLDPAPARAAVIAIVASVAAAAVWKDFHAISGTRRLFLAALALGTTVVLVRG